ncbi:hypothetical protein ATK78_4332 [Pedobacter metabolipauper]|uniref:Uncharacterized protein n=2 Tax=Pedobacter metabolipauper TaxID=425513 RepID=A0A4R6SSE7_9SPHI|nr:hypothetical protein ATK78_4332 [Pedobacter metabolipauper]
MGLSHNVSSILQQTDVSMKRYLTVCLIFMFSSCNILHGQRTEQNESFNIYNLVIKNLKKADKLTVREKTEKSYLKDFDFKNPIFGYDVNGSFNQKDWILFLNDVDTGTIKDYKLQTKGDKWFKDNLENNPSYEIIFAPVIFSNNLDKAISIFGLYSTLSKSSGGTTVFFFERQKNEWMLKSYVTVLYFD